MSVDLLTTWVLGNGPCGPLAICSEADVGRSTLSSRTSMELAEHDRFLFGNFSTLTRQFQYDSYPHVSQIYPTSSNVTDYSSTVFAVSENYAWEQELMRFKLPFSDQDKYEFKLT